MQLLLDIKDDVSLVHLERKLKKHEFEKLCENAKVLTNEGVKVLWE